MNWYIQISAVFLGILIAHLIVDLIKSARVKRHKPTEAEAIRTLIDKMQDKGWVVTSMMRDGRAISIDYDTPGRTVVELTKGDIELGDTE